MALRHRFDQGRALDEIEIASLPERIAAILRKKAPVVRAGEPGARIRRIRLKATAHPSPNDIGGDEIRLGMIRHSLE